MFDMHHAALVTRSTSIAKEGSRVDQVRLVAARDALERMPGGGARVRLSDPSPSVQGMTRDLDRAAVYRCEDLYSRMCDRANPPSGPVVTQLAGSEVMLPAQRKFSSVEEARPYIAAVLSAVRPRWPGGFPGVQLRRSRGESAHWEAPATIAIPESRSMLREHVVLHELAHHIDHHVCPVGGPAHGAHFRQVLCHLHRAATGVVGGWALQVIFDTHLATDDLSG